MADAARIAHLRGLEAHLCARIRGQDHLMPAVASAFCRAALALAAPDRPRASMLFVGPTGTGKSETFACAVDYVYGGGRLATIDMSEYQDRSAVNKLIGEDRGDAGLLGRTLGSLSSGGLLFDEIEKAYPAVMDLFLQMLWRGCITVATGQTFHLGEFVIGFSSNIGAAEAMRMTHSKFSSVEQATLRRVEQTLRPEFVSRLDAALVFSRLSPKVQREICALEVEREITRLRRSGYDLQVSQGAIEFLIREGFHPHLGARPLRKAVERHLQDAIVRDLFATGCGRGPVLFDGNANNLVVAHP
jgi:ATP-dependent Clp protease ATP-binding subunit ClpC